MNINEFAVNEKSEVDGIWKELGGGTALLIARANNTNYQNKLRELMAPYRGAVGVVKITDEEATKIMNEALTGTVLLNWRNLADTVDGKDVIVEYSDEAALDWLTRYKEFKKIVEMIAQDIDNYKDAAEEATKENLEK